MTEVISLGGDDPNAQWAKQFKTREERDAAMCQEPDRWSQWPLLPLKRVSDSEAGFLVDNGEPRVYLGNIFMLFSGPLAPQLEGLKVIQYISFKVLVDDWAVD